VVGVSDTTATGGGRHGGTTGRIGTLLRLGARQFRRTPVLLGLLLFLPAYMVGVFATVAPDDQVPLHLTDETVRRSLTAAMPGFTTPMVAALLAGIAGLFLMQSTAAADGRLTVAGYRAHEVVLARLGLLAGVSLVASGVAVGAAMLAFDPASVGWFAAGTVLTALAYGLVGVLAGVTLDRLPGVYLIMFGSMVDLFLFQNPLATDAPEAATLLPGHYPLALATDAAFAGTVELAHLGWALAYLGGLLAVATLAFYRGTRVD
jgi:ABC-2 type transport system permease protein